MKDVDRRLGLLFNSVARFRGILFDQMMQSSGLTSVQVFALNHLFNTDGLTQVELADRLDLGTVTVCGLIDRLELAGWVERKPDEKDRRAKRIWLTSKVDRIKNDIYSNISELNEVTLAGINDQDVDHLIDMLGVIKSNLSTTLGRGSRKSRPKNK